ncbi:breast carcinoma-amplified sequence 3 homolog isoform X2 [Anneissia japonica]|uniref:breast carcinoma-amplified sequence 3 homolog isoform X2 n=1 Tax=Anneissia japonica TaxID=1529436 RepID=UPI001425B4F9|nr:breast carcinoma-amplified sequence 3 homolog isoform X2 [Anneissia japonica]
MSFPSPRRSSKSGIVVIRPQPASDKSYMSSVVDFLHDAYSGGQKTDDKEMILWVRFENLNTHDLQGYCGSCVFDNDHCLVLLIIGYSNGAQIWHLTESGEAHELMSLRQGPIRILRVLPKPFCQQDSNQLEKRPLIAVCDGTGSAQPFCSVSMQSLKSGEQVHSISFQTPVCDIICNKRILIVALQEKVAAFDAVTFKKRFCITTCYPSGPPNLNPLALSSRWLAYADRKLISRHQSGGGICNEGVYSYTATVIHAAKTITKGISMFGQTVGNLASTKLSNSPPRTNTNNEKAAEDRGPNSSLKNLVPGIVTIIDANSITDEFNLTNDTSEEGLIAHFPAHHSHPISALAFDPSGTLLFTADKLGHDFNVFKVMSHPCGSSLGSVHHLYVLHRGDTSAKVQDVCFTNDSRWICVSTMRETSHVFPITPYGGSVGIRTHTAPKIVNKESRFHKSAGLEEIQKSEKRNVASLSSSPTSQGFHSQDSVPSLTHNNALNANLGNPRLPPFPQPVVVTPYAQIKQPTTLAGMTSSSGRPHSAGNGTQTGDLMGVCACFSSCKGSYPSSPKLPGEKPEIVKASMVESLYIMGHHGLLVEYHLDPHPANSTNTKKADDSPLELQTTAHAQWHLQRGSNWAELRPPLLVSNPSSQLDSTPSGSVSSDGKSPSGSQTSSNSIQDEFDDQWLEEVEMVTHAGPHRRLWMGPQFHFKPFPQTTTTVLGSHSPALLPQSLESTDIALETEDLYDLQSLNLQPRSEPMPTPRSSKENTADACHMDEMNSLPTFIEYGSGNFDQMPHLLEVSCSSPEVPEDALKYNLAEAMADGEQYNRTEMHTQFDGSSEQLNSSSSSSEVNPNSFEATSSAPALESVLVFPASSSPDSC